MGKVKQLQSPITLYVESVQQEIPVMEFVDRISVVDIEMSCQHAKELLVYLRKRDCKESVGAIRVRLTGKLVIS